MFQYCLSVYEKSTVGTWSVKRGRACGVGESEFLPQMQLFHCVRTSLSLANACRDRLSRGQSSRKPALFWSLNPLTLSPMAISRAFGTLFQPSWNLRAPQRLIILQYEYGLLHGPKQSSLYDKVQDHRCVTLDSIGVLPSSPMSPNSNPQTFITVC